MDPRRFLIAAAAGLLLSGCALLRPADPASSSLATLSPNAASVRVPVPVPEPDVIDVGSGEAAPAFTAEPAPAGVETDSSPVPYETVASIPRPSDRGAPETSGRRAIVAANAEARSASRSDAFVGGVQVFAWAPGRVFEVWTAPLRVTTLTLGEGETLVSKAAGDTVRWQIGETTSGTGAAQRAHVLLKPLERGLETNLVLTTNQRVYFLELKSGPADGFNAAVAWDAPPAGTAGRSLAAGESAGLAAPEVAVADPVVTPQGPLDARYRIEPRGRRARWTPIAVFNDGTRTFIAFSGDLQVDEAPALFVLAADGESQLVNYRQAGGLFIVDRLFDRAELRLGDRRPQIVRIHRLQGDAR